MSYLSLMNHTAIQIFTTKTYHNYAYILKHTRTLTNNKYHIARSQNTNSIHTHTTTTKTYYSYIPTTKINIIHHQQTYLRRTLQNTTNTTYDTHTKTKIKEIFTVPATVLTLNHHKPKCKVDRRQTYYSCIFYLFLYTY